MSTELNKEIRAELEKSGMNAVDIGRIASAIAEVSAKAGVEAYMREKKKAQKETIDRRFRNTKCLMRNYREIKLHAGDAIAALSEVEEEDYDFFKAIMDNADEIDVKAIVTSRARSAIMLAHIDAMLRTFEIICLGSKREEEQRRYRVLEAMYLLDDPLSVDETAGRENVDRRTIYRDLDAACEKLGALLFGIQMIASERA